MVCAAESEEDVLTRVHSGDGGALPHPAVPRDDAFAQPCCAACRACMGSTAGAAQRAAATHGASTYRSTSMYTSMYSGAPPLQSSASQPHSHSQWAPQRRLALLGQSGDVLERVQVRCCFIIGISHH